VNYVLRAIGESPIASLPATQADVVQILGCFNDVASEVLAMQRWKFNSDIGFQIQPSGQILWSNPAQGDVETLNVFEVPATLASYRATPTYQQTGPQYTDVGYRQAQIFSPDGGSTFPLVFYDRAKNREGWNAGAYPWLAMDTWWFTPFVNLPYAAQLYICAQTARRTVQQGVNSAEIADFVKIDEAKAYAMLIRDYSPEDGYNALRTVNAFRAYGNRPATNVGFIDIRGLAPAQTEIQGTVLPCTVTNATISQPRNTTFVVALLVTNPNGLAVNLQFNTAFSGTVATAPSLYTVANIPANGTFSAPVTITLANSPGAGSVSLSVHTLINNLEVAGSPNTGTITVTST
jgi:hypothetical protein